MDAEVFAAPSAHAQSEVVDKEQEDEAVRTPRRADMYGCAAPEPADAHSLAELLQFKLALSKNRHKKAFSR